MCAESMFEPMCDGQMAEDEFIFRLRRRRRKSYGQEDHREMLFCLRGHCPVFPCSDSELGIDDSSIALSSALPFCASKIPKHISVASSWLNHDDLRT